MAYNEKLANRIRERFEDLPNVEEKKMMGGLTFMYNGKMIPFDNKAPDCLFRSFDI